ncbi:tRNA preQ1(34) S-adenosylmethionine ribosyltransferase-isomerase QueA [Granulicella sp. WH15]|uniref:tRNA preQ1(34) S-adenosylmethionine ribosyltransferase-isomerase QueA n=1 Tax=Granulicella sp. WH15 TaxID=2602070 RepID=UPI001366F890|nr:tRNA preQ1(34) S-adenosylmethionine ribosyltransferase-isomerase QueA [Granulicella sp. WH15]QHN02715.1 tRNA preQ1(34) S-adenosylmethionine ribosyltransferase-isomerase QueA [Granulicella sp. WH15]
MLVSDFHYELPEELIAQTPPEVRGSSRMLVLRRDSGALTDDRFLSLPEYLKAGDLLVLNDSRVIPARLYATRGGLATQASSPAPTGKIEVLLTQQMGPWEWTALVRPGRKVQPGEVLHFADAEGAVLLSATVFAAGEYGERTIRFEADGEFLAKLDRIGHMPLPPYIHRDDSAGDKARYQTVYANEPGSAAAPTAGLHFTPEVLAALEAKGVQVERVTLHVGLGTFQPVRAERVEDIRLHAEHYTLPEATAAAVNAARREGRRVIAAGTTTTRTLEHCATLGPELFAHSGETSIFISPGHRFQVVQGLVTNFHLPSSTLLMLVSALAGVEPVRAAYAHAVREKYRFFSYGDCMLMI